MTSRVKTRPRRKDKKEFEVEKERAKMEAITYHRQQQDPPWLKIYDFGEPKCNYVDLLFM